MSCSGSDQVGLFHEYRFFEQDFLVTEQLPALYQIGTSLVHLSYLNAMILHVCV